MTLQIDNLNGEQPPVQSPNYWMYGCLFLSFMLILISLAMCYTLGKTPEDKTQEINRLVEDNKRLRGILADNKHSDSSNERQKSIIRQPSYILTKTTYEGDDRKSIISCKSFKSSLSGEEIKTFFDEDYSQIHNMSSYDYFR